MANLFHILHIFDANNLKLASPDRMCYAIRVTLSRKWTMVTQQPFSLPQANTNERTRSFLTSEIHQVALRCPYLFQQEASDGTT
jgi:hypothetical protein